MFRSNILTEQQEKNIEQKTKTLLTPFKNIKYSKDTLITEMQRSYDTKSHSRFTYFVKQIAPMYNHLKGGYMSNLWESGVYKFRNNLEPQNNSTLDIRLTEKENGLYLKNQDNRKIQQILSKIRYLEYVNKDKTALFLTITAPSRFHYYTKSRKNNKHYKNKKCIYDDYEDSITQRYKIIRKIQRRFYFNLNNEKVEKDFFLMFEPHKSLTPHLHMLLWVDKKDIESVKKSFDLVVNQYQLKQVDFEEIHTAKASSYITKYLVKTLNESETDNALMRLYKSYFHKFRIFSSSNFRHSTQKEIDFVYKYISKEYPEYMYRLKESSIPLFYNLEQYIKNGKFIFEYEENESVVVDYKSSEKTVNALYTEYKQKRSHIEKTFKEQQSQVYNKVKKEWMEPCFLTKDSQLDAVDYKHIKDMSKDKIQSLEKVMQKELIKLEIEYKKIIERVYKSKTNKVKIKKISKIFNNFNIFDDRGFIYNGNGILDDATNIPEKYKHILKKGMRIPELIYQSGQYELLDNVNFEEAYNKPFNYQLRIDERFWLD